MAEGDHPWRRRWSGGDTIWRKGTIHGAVDGPGGTLYGGRGPSMALRMVRPDHVRRRGWSPGPTVGGDHIWHDRSMRQNVVCTKVVNKRTPLEFMSLLWTTQAFNPRSPK